ncbi:MAG: hypothetical protein RIT26_1670 [Pseudomonadota bacterium]|jgi:hypothetical protein
MRQTHSGFHLAMPACLVGFGDGQVQSRNCKHASHALEGMQSMVQTVPIGLSRQQAVQVCQSARQICLKGLNQRQEIAGFQSVI